MGGRGSGRSAGYGLLVDKCEDLLSIDLTFLRKRNALFVGNRGELTWSRRGEKYAQVNYIIEAGGLRLIYRTRSGGHDWQDVDELIPFTETEAQFGGRRRWLLCKSCAGRCRVIYGGPRFRCRKCHQLKYESQYEPIFGRATEQRHKLRKRLGYVGSLEDPFPPKPKGMHWKTYRRLEARDQELEQRWCLDLAGWLERTQSHD